MDYNAFGCHILLKIYLIVINQISTKWNFAFPIIGVLNIPSHKICMYSKNPSPLSGFDVNYEQPLDCNFLANSQKLVDHLW